MNHEAVLMVRIYLAESQHLLKPLLKLLLVDLKVRGVTVLRGIEGYGPSGQHRGSSLLDLSLDLPLVVEFFDRPERVEAAIARIRDFVPPDHIVSWPATIASEDPAC
ncbi:hypothetical protein CKO25_08015 [Thiocapsa imhoffii]|uniref:DUF190 domain-containing protein n=1 Tax=Thiocapsa imhoffii TaxID=382777 RepID=A0A9X0WH39_9GAMM|nr:DUF190 domain-containing protein [Thiocapsa imhoffii]MBK1644594.1 hypothetical protein [Thiocapsa imhoffii]